MDAGLSDISRAAITAMADDITSRWWRDPGSVRLTLAGGLLSGVVGALLFATAHAVIIVPIWSRMWSGLAWGALAGLAAGWALAELSPATGALPARRAAALGARFGALLWLLVAPVSGVDAILRSLGVAARHELLEVVTALAIAIGAGAAAGWRRTHRWRATIALALATTMLTVAMAGPVPIARSPRALGIFIAVLPAAMIAGAVLALMPTVQRRWNPAINELQPR